MANRLGLLAQAGSFLERFAFESGWHRPLILHFGATVLARVPCAPGLQFASRYPGDPHRVTMLESLPTKCW